MAFMTDFSQFTFGGGSVFDDAANRAKTRSNEDQVSAMERHRRQQMKLLEPFERENRLYRKPCPKCSNLVRPELLGQHYDAYHPNDAHPAS